MTKSGRKWAKLLLTTTCFAWVGVAGWAMFSDLPDDSVQTHNSEIVKGRMKECDGTFKQRYECKEAIVIDAGRKTFWSLTERLLIVTLPAIFAGIGGGIIIRRIPEDRPPAPVADTDWKRRAQKHIAHPSMDDHNS